MRKRISFDLWCCMGIALLIALCTSFGYDKIVGDKQYDAYIEKNDVEAGGVGDFADDNIKILTSLDEVKNGEYTVFFEDATINSFNMDATGAFADIGYLNVITLESGEKVAVFLDIKKVKETEDGLYLPIGEFVPYDLKSSQFWTQYALISDEMPDIDSGYINFGGDSLTVNQEEYKNNANMMVTAITFVIVFVILRFVGGKIGLFASVFALDLKKKESDVEHNEKI